MSFINNFKHLRKNKLYSSSDIISSIQSDNFEIKRFNKYLKEQEINGRLEWVNKKEFFKRKSILKEKRILKPIDKISISHNCIKPSKHPMFRHLFWSNLRNPIPLDSYISRIINEDSFAYYSSLSSIFGEKRIIEVYLKHFYPHNKKASFEEYFNL